MVVFGGGAEVLPDLSRLLIAGASVRLVAPDVCPAIEALATSGRISWEAREWQAADLEDAWLAIARTPDPAENTAITEAATKRRLFCLANTHEPERSPRRRAAGPPLPDIALVGAGPGDPGLITVRGKEFLQAADVVVIDRLAPLELLADLEAGVEVVDAAKIPYGRSAVQRNLNEVMIERARAGRFVVRLKGGDPYVFGRGFEEVAACAEAGLRVTVVPGISSALAVPALAGTPVTHRGMTHELTIVSGHLAPDAPGTLVDWAALSRLRGTLVVLMGVAHIEEIANALTRGGKDPCTPALLVQEGATCRQRVVRSTLGRLAADCAEHKVEPPSVFVIGEVAGLPSAGSTAELAATEADD